MQQATRMSCLLQCAVLLFVSQVTGLASCPVLLGGKYCMQVSPAAQQHEAVEYCYELWDHADLSVWQIYQHQPYLFRELRLRLLQLRVHQVWLEAEAPHAGGLYLHTHPGSSLFNTPVVGLNLTSGHTSNTRCLTWEVSAMVHHPRACRPSLPRRYFPAICLMLKEPPVRTAPVSCPNEFYVALRVVKKCVSVRKADGFVDWSQSTEICKALHRDAHVVQTGYSALVHGGSGICPVGLRKVVNGFGEARYIWDRKDQDLEEVDGKISEQLRYVNLSQSALLGAVHIGSNPSLFLVANNFTFSCVACEMPIPEVVSPALMLKFSSENDAISIVLEVKNDFMLLSGRLQEGIGAADSVKLRCFTDAKSFYPLSVNVALIGGSLYSLSWQGDGSYWCSAQDVFTLQSVVSNTILVRKADGASQTWAVLVQTNSTVLGRYVFLPQINISDVPGTSYTSTDDGWLSTLSNILVQNSLSLKLKRMYRNGTQFILHITSQNELNVVSTKAEAGGVTYSIIYVRNVDFCPHEVVLLNDVLLQWPKTQIGEYVVQEKNCLQYSKTCEGEFSEGAYWSIHTLHRNCRSNKTWSHREVGASDAAAISEVGETVQNVHPEIHSAATTLQELANCQVNKTTLLTAVDIFDKVLNYNIGTLVNGRSTGSDIMKNMDTILKNVEIQEEFLKIVKGNIAVFVSGESSAGEISGISFSNPQQASRKHSEIGNSNFNVLHYNQTKSLPFEKSDVDLAVVFSDSVLKLKPRMSVIIFENNSVLLSASKWDTKNMVLNSKVAGVVVKGKDQIFKDGSEDFVNIMFKPQKVVGKKLCAYWNFDTWSWETEGCEINSTLEDLDICRCQHATYFAEMIIGGGNVLSSINQVALDVISIIGCSLSLVGLLGIYMTAVMFPSWRQQLGSQLLLSLSAAVGFKMVMFLVAAMGKASNGAWCVVVGAGLHYTLLASFCWMLLIALLQYKRLVSVFGNVYPTRLLLKGSLFCWGVPSVPVMLLLLIDPDLYTTHTGVGPWRKFCYPSGIAFYMAVVLPVSLITAFNAFMFVIIIVNISNCVNREKTKAYGVASRKAHLYRALMGLLLFFLLGTTWVFGLLAHITLFAYIFCITATLQGAVLFLYFIAGSHKTRAKWCIKIPKLNAKISETASSSITNKTLHLHIPAAQELYLQISNAD